jgi:hypothetical protein
MMREGGGSIVTDIISGRLMRAQLHEGGQPTPFLEIAISCDYESLEELTRWVDGLREDNTLVSLRRVDGSIGKTRDAA